MLCAKKYNKKANTATSRFIDKEVKIDDFCDKKICKLNIYHILGAVFDYQTRLFMPRRARARLTHVDSVLARVPLQ